MPVPIRIYGSNTDSTYVFNHTSDGQEFTVAVSEAVNYQFDPQLWLLSTNSLNNNVGISESSNPVSITLFPNPTEGISSIRSNRTIDEVKVYSVDGQEIMNFSEVNSKEFDVNLSNYVTGIYFIRITSLQQTFYKKVVKK
jgi:hypothetical protein